MTSARRWWGRKAAVAGAGVLLALAAGNLTAPARADVASKALPADPCPAPVALSSVKAGLVGEGLTVVSGSTPVPFKVDVLGVLADGLGVGRDLIMIKVSDYDGQHVIDQGQGIWAGMSGSPVYVDGQLLGAVSYGFTYSASPIGGVTPAADMVDVLGLGTAPAQARSPLGAASKVRMSAAAKRELAAKAGVATPRGTMQQLVTPLAVSGLAPKRINRLQKDADAAGLAVRAYAAGRHDAPKAGAVPVAKPTPGGNFVAAVSYGDVTLAGTGTTTAVCGDQVLAFGHPFLAGGPVSYGANDADVLSVVVDNFDGSWKISNIGDDFGTVDQDRFAAIRGDLTRTPELTEVTTTIHNGDTQKERTGTTSVVDQAYLSTALVYSAWGNYDATFDEVGDGVATTDWTIKGTRAGGKPFEVSRSNRWADRYELTFEPPLEIANAADALVNNDFEKVHIDSVTFGSTAKTEFDQLNITKLAVSVNGGKYSSPKQLRVKVGDKLKLRVTLRPYRSATTKTTTLALTVPKSAKGQVGLLSATGGVELGIGGDEDVDSECLLVGDCQTEEEGSLDAVIKSITSPPRNDAVVAELMLQSEEDGELATAATVTKLKTRTVTGGRSIAISIR